MYLAFAALTELRVLKKYRRAPLPLAIAIAIVGAALSSLVCGAAAVFLTDLLLIDKFDGPTGLGGGILVVLVALNTAVPAFIVTLTLLVNWHHQTSWLAPTVAFVSCVLAIRALGTFDIQFAPFVLTTGLLAWIVSCWIVRKKRKPVSEHAF